MMNSAIRRHWKSSAVAHLIATGEHDLDDIEKMIDSTDDKIQLGSKSDRADLGALRRDGQELKNTLREAREVHRKLKAEAQTQ